MLSPKRKSSELSAPSGLAMSGKIYAPLFSGVELSAKTGSCRWRGPVLFCQAETASSAIFFIL
jgi:hypothetical protein